MTNTLDTFPTEAGYIAFIRDIMGVPDTILPDDSPYINMSYDISLETVNMYLSLCSSILYTQAVYNLAADILVNIAQDNPDLPPPDNTYWSDLRTKFNLNVFTLGVVNEARDEDTSAATLVPVGLRNLTIADLQNLKTPWGRIYLSIAQSVGTLWGLTV